MRIRKILVPLQGGEGDDLALGAAFAAAARFDAHVEGMFLRPDPADAVPMVGEHVTAGLIDDMIRAADEDARARAAAARQTFDAARAAGGEGASAAFREVTGRAGALIAYWGRLADLIVLPHRPEDDVRATLALEAALLETGRGVLVTPSLRAEGRHVAIAWNGRREAARAVSSAMPFIEKAEKVTILSAKTGATDPAAGRDLAAYLAWRDIKAELRVVEPGDRSVGAALLQDADAAGADMLALGGYGHSRLREFVLGGVTRDVLRSAALPVIMAH